MLDCRVKNMILHLSIFKQCKKNTDSLPLNSRTTKMCVYQGPITYLLIIFFIIHL